MYRFRPTYNLLDGYKELEKQEIYFAAPDELNDPMEGYRDIFWRGDTIVWENFVKNYLRSLEGIFSLNMLLNNERKVSKNDISSFKQLINFRSPLQKTLLDQIYKESFKNQFVSEFPKKLSNRITPIRRDELISYLTLIHSFLLNSVAKIYYENKLTHKPFFNQEVSEFETINSEWNKLLELMSNVNEQDKLNELESIFTFTNSFLQSIKLSKRRELDSNIMFNYFFMVFEFPEEFVSKLEMEIYPPWYSSSFLYNYTNSAIWGYYGDNHKGVCLKFKSQKNEKGNYFLNLEKEYGYNSKPMIGFKPIEFKKMGYHNKYVEIDFFRSIGRMTKSELNHFWYKDQSGNFSACGEHLNKNEEEWVDSYWNNFDQSISVKLNEWQYENEYRLVVHGDFIDYSDKGKRKLRYEFNDLEAIIFGIKTTNSDKVELIKIIEKKCILHNRNEFDIFQAYYSKKSGKIDTYKLRVLNLK